MFPLAGDRAINLLDEVEHKLPGNAARGGAH